MGLIAFVGDPLTIWLEAGNVLGGAGWEGQAFRDGYTELTGRRLPRTLEVLGADRGGGVFGFGAVCGVFRVDFSWALFKENTTK